VYEHAALGMGHPSLDDVTNSSTSTAFDQLIVSFERFESNKFQELVKLSGNARLSTTLYNKRYILYTAIVSLIQNDPISFAMSNMFCHPEDNISILTEMINLIRMFHKQERLGAFNSIDELSEYSDLHPSVIIPPLLAYEPDIIASMQQSIPAGWLKLIIAKVESDPNGNCSTNRT